MTPMATPHIPYTECILYIRDSSFTYLPLSISKRDIYKLTRKRDDSYYKVRQLILLQSATAVLLQSVTSFITQCDKCYYKV